MPAALLAPTPHHHAPASRTKSMLRSKATRPRRHATKHSPDEIATVSEGRRRQADTAARNAPCEADETGRTLRGRRTARRVDRTFAGYFAVSGCFRGVR